MLIIRLLRPQFNIQGFMAVLTGLIGWVLILLSHPNIPTYISLPRWEPSYLLISSPALWVDETSWYFALAIATLALSALITSIAQLGQSGLPAQQLSQNHLSNNDKADISDEAVQSPIILGERPTSGWLLWVSILFITSLGLLAVTAANLLTFLLAWAAIDLLELVILLSQMIKSRTRESIILAFSAKVSATCIVIIATVLPGPRGAALSSDTITWPATILLLLAVGLRLGVLPLHLPYTKGLPINRNLATVLRLVSAAGSFILLVRLPSIGGMGGLLPYLLGLTLLAGIYAAIKWLLAKDELDGRPYWLIGTSSLAIASAILSQPAACLAWVMASLLSGGMVLSMSLRHRKLIPLVTLGVVNLSGLPFSPTWQVTSLFQFPSLTGIGFAGYGVGLFFILLIQAFLLAGFTHHILRGILSDKSVPSIHVERWAWALFPFGLILILLIHLVIGWFMLPNLNKLPLSAWIMGPSTLILSAVLLYLAHYLSHSYRSAVDPNLRSVWDRVFSLNWIYRLFWRIYRTLTRVFALVSLVLEGDGGLLWALVLFSLIFVFLQR